LAWAGLAAGLGPAGCTAGTQTRAEIGDPLQRLQEGNERFASGRPRHDHEDAARRHETAAHGQHPFATVVACADSRVPVELIFDQGVGDVFVIRVAGNVCYLDEAASIDYAVEHLQMPLVVLLGHSQCGAVTAAVRHAREHGSLVELLQRIAPAVDRAAATHPELEGDALIDAAIRENVWHNIEMLITHSDAVRAALEAGRLRVVGALYDIDSGQVEWMGPHPRQADLAASSSLDGFPGE
jgi:carbonic anhydrase